MDSSTTASDTHIKEFCDYVVDNHVDADTGECGPHTCLSVLVFYIDFCSETGKVPVSVDVLERGLRQRGVFEWVDYQQLSDCEFYF